MLTTLSIIIYICLIKTVKWNDCTLNISKKWRMYPRNSFGMRTMKLIGMAD